MLKLMDKPFVVYRDKSTHSAHIKTMKSILISITMASAILGLHGAARALPINLSERELFIKTGFSEKWITDLPNDPSWLRVPPGKSGKRSLNFMDLKIRDKPVRKFLSFKETPAYTYTFVTSFFLSERDLNENRFLGLFIKFIGVNWEVYLNGHLVKSEMYVSPDGNIQKWRCMRDQALQLHPHMLRRGENIVAFKIVGDPTIPDTGMYMNAPILIDDYDVLLKKKSETIALILIAIYLFIGLYHFMLYLNRRSELYNLYFGLFLFMLSSYFLCRTNTMNSLVLDSKLLALIEFCLLYTLIPLFMFFMGAILLHKIRIFEKLVAVFYGVLIVLTAAMHFSFDIDILRIWQATVVIPVLYSLVFQMIQSLRSAVNTYRSLAIDGRKPGLPEAIVQCLARTVPGNLLIGSIVVLVCLVLDILDSIYMNQALNISRYGFFVFVIGITLVLTNRYVFVYSRIDGLSTDLSRKSSDLKEAHVKIGISEEKYKLLVEGTRDMIFSLDESFRFLTANKALYDTLGISPSELCTKTFLDTVHESDERSVARQFVLDKLNEFVRDKLPVSLKIDLKSSFGIEPVPMQIRLEYINIEGRNEIFGRGASIAEDILNQYLDFEHQKFRIGNLLLLADDISYRITRNLQKYMDKKLNNIIRIAVREMIFNAIEHGNLGISFEEKSHAILNDSYNEYIKRRQKDPQYRDKTVYVEYEIDPEKVTYVITDEGSGFDFYSYLDNVGKAKDQLLPHGRGVTFSKNVFDEVIFNDKGNMVTLVKYFRKTVAS